ncbi:hypothetical protein BKA62DRAFT_827827 [Auriculariales sp. MPI-PUGE-AT-0066]|nr:hypothetical protein BKA62DRAFT_827827 [Auriculariales sp. MPI-PUGE-AT-0066]
MFAKSFAVVILSLAGLCVAQTVVLAEGVTPASASIDSTFSWQSATGKITHGPCGSQAHPIQINDCYGIQLSSNASQMLDQGHLDSPRQRAEFLTMSIATGAFGYSWRSYLSSQTGTSNSFFHLMQVLSRDDGGPIITLNAVAGQVVVKDYVRANITSPSMSLSQFTDRTVIHRIKGVYSANGSLDYRISDVNGTQLLRYTVATGNTGGHASIKFGAYRKAFDGMTVVLASVGDFNVI